MSGWEGLAPTPEDIAEMLAGLVLLGYVEIIGVNENGDFLYSKTDKLGETPIERIISEMNAHEMAHHEMTHRLQEDGADGDI